MPGVGLRSSFKIIIVVAHVLMILLPSGCRRPASIVLDADLPRIDEALSALSPANEGRTFEISGSRIREGKLMLDLSTEWRGEGWREVGSAICERPGDVDVWSCSRHAYKSYALLRGGGEAPLVGLHGADGAAAVRYLEEMGSQNPVRGYAIECLASRGKDAVVVQYAGYSHAQRNIGFVGLRRTDDGFSLEGVEPPADWFHAPTSASTACSMGLPMTSEE